MQEQQTETIFERKYGPKSLGKPYTIILDEKDREQLQEWKKEIDVVIQEAKEKYQAGSEYERTMIGENPTQEDFTLYAIGRFLRDIKTGWTARFNVLVVINAVRGGVRNITDFGKENKDMSRNEFDNCIDGSVLVNELAKMYKITGEVKDVKTIGDQNHHYWQQTPTEEKKSGTIVDIFAAKKFLVRDQKGDYNRILNHFR